MIRQPCSLSGVGPEQSGWMKHHAGEGMSRNAEGVNSLWPRYTSGSGQSARRDEAYTDGEVRKAVIGLPGVRRDGACRELTLGTESPFHTVSQDAICAGIHNRIDGWKGVGGAQSSEEAGQYPWSEGALAGSGGVQTLPTKQCKKERDPIADKI